MEWQGWYFGFMCENILGKILFEIPGKDMVVFADGFNEINYDFKAHSEYQGYIKVPTMDLEVEQAIADYGEVCFIVNVEKWFDDDEQTLKMHDNLKR